MNPILFKFGNWLGKNQRIIRSLQWLVIIFYAILVIVPAFLKVPDDSGTILHNLTTFAQFMFWGIWWPFVLVSIILFGRLWCGVLCPEGSLSEFANKYSLGWSIPRWMRFKGWPFITFSLTTIYGQMTSVYQYPKPVLLVLGGSTLAAIIVGLIYGKSSRVWCKYLCPVTGVFALLTRLAPFRFKPDKHAWDNHPNKKIIQIHCPTIMPLRTMSSSAECLMCGKCSNHRQAIKLTPRSPNEEIVINGYSNQSIWQSILIIFGLCGLALAAFQWPNSFWLNHIRDVVDSWFLVHNINWVFATNTPWWIFTHYPDQGDAFSWIFGIELLSYIVGIGLTIASINTLIVMIATKITGKLSLSRFNHLSLSLIPIGACCVFIGLVANTITILEKYANLGFTWTTEARFILIGLATIWSMILAAKIIHQYTKSKLRIATALIIISLSYLIIDYSWVLVLHIWTIKSDSIPWNTLWI